ncbi:MAG: tetratricopeptide repeat protein [Pyrinomonadaceae bacterium]|nr:tetratricopeptide repeat protein [Pyrinomonadaceae bacterium]
MKITSPKLDTSHLSANEAALHMCERALELKDKGDYDGAQKVMRPLWRGVGGDPEPSGLHSSVAAEVFLTVGILTGWVGSRSEIKEAQEAAKNLITESITYYEAVGDLKKCATARAEIAHCYWREGELNEARIMLVDALQKLTAEGHTRARALIKLIMVEVSASRFKVALGILDDNAPLFKKVTNHTIRGNYHNELAIVLRHLAKSEPLNREDHLQRALSQLVKADHHFQLARNNVIRACVKNNVGMMLLNLGRYKEAQRYLEEARRLSLIVRDKVRTAQIDETRAQVLIAQRKYKDAEALAKRAASVLERSGQKCLLADALITRGIALARLKQTDRAQFVFQEAIEVAQQVGALNKAGLAALTLIEELGEEVSEETLTAAYDRASEWLANSQCQDVLLRLNTAGRKLLSISLGEVNSQDATQAIRNKTCHLQTEVLKFEEGLIRQALAQADGRLTRAASLLKMSYQALAYIIESRHTGLLDKRSPVHRRRARKEHAANAKSDA